MRSFCQRSTAPDHVGSRLAPDPVHRASGPRGQRTRYSPPPQVGAESVVIGDPDPPRGAQSGAKRRSAHGRGRRRPARPAAGGPSSDRSAATMSQVARACPTSPARSRGSSPARSSRPCDRRSDATSDPRRVTFVSSANVRGRRLGHRLRDQRGVVPEDAEGVVVAGAVDAEGGRRVMPYGRAARRTDPTFGML